MHKVYSMKIISLKNIYPIVSVFFAAIVSFFWEIGDNLIILTSPGWAFALSIFATHFFQNKQYAFRKIPQYIVWILVTAFCFFQAFSVTYEASEGSGDFFFQSVFLAGFISSFIMMFSYNILIKKIEFKKLLFVSLMGGMVSFMVWPAIISGGYMIILFASYFGTMSYFIGKEIKK